VGKTALFKLEGIYVFSNHMTRIRVNSQLVEPEYLARYLHFLWRAGYYRQRAKRWVSQAAIDQSALSEFKIALPTIPEQQRIVAISRQADELRRLREEVTLFITLPRTLWGAFKQSRALAFKKTGRPLYDS
jgi:type I restriction enzyme S subunit